MGLFSKIKESSKKNRNSILGQPAPPSGPGGSSPNPSTSTFSQSSTAGLQTPSQTSTNIGHSSSNLTPGQENQGPHNIPIPQQQLGSQQPPWGYSSSPNPSAQGQYWSPPQQQQPFGFPNQVPQGQPIYILQNGQLVPVYMGQQGPPSGPGGVSSPMVGASPSNPGAIYQYNPSAAQTQTPNPYGTSPYQIPSMPAPPTAPGSIPYLQTPSSAQPHLSSYPDNLTVSPVSPVSEYSSGNNNFPQSQPLKQPSTQTATPVVETPQNVHAPPKSMARKPVPGMASSATPPPTTSSILNQDMSALSISETPATSPEPQRIKAQLSPQIEQKVELLKNQGNSMVEAKNFDQAIMFYTMALDYNPDSAVCLSNRSMAYTKLQPAKMKEAKEDAENATRADPGYWKGWSRLGDALLSMGDASQAVNAYNKALEVGGTSVGQNTKQSLANAKKTLEQNQSKAPASPAKVPQPSTSTRRTSTYVPPAAPAPSAPANAYNPPQPKPALVDRKPTAPPPAAVPTAATGPPPAPAQPPSARAHPPPLSTQTAPATNIPSSATAPASSAAASSPTSPSGNAPTRQLNTQAVSSLPAVLQEAVANVEEVVNADVPPAYAPNPNSTDPTIRHMSQQAVYSQVIELRNTLLIRNKGSFVIKPYTAVGNIDAVRIEFVGMTTQELTARELGVHPDQHPSFSGYFVNSLLYPGCTLIDLDMEVSKIGEGRFPGTYSVSGYSEIYRSQQLETAPILPITLSSVHPLPEVTVDQIVTRMTVLRYNRLLPETNMQMYEKLREFLGPDPYPNQTDADKANLRNQITDICYVLNRVDAARYVDMSNCRHLTNNTLGTAAQGIGLKNFLFQILLGCELLVRLLKEPPTASYTGLISHNISANLVISDLWMQNIDTRRETTPAGLPRHLLISLVHQRQCEGLIRFAETLKWPHMDEARNYIEGAYNDLITGKAIGFDMCDWLFGLVRPGKLFRHLIMNCLVYSSPSIRDFQGAPTFTCGLALHNRSYWPRRSVLGGVLGGLRNLTTVCGWVGPAPKADGVEVGWCQVDARKVTIPIPCTKSQRTAEELEEARIGPDGRAMTAEEQISDLADITQWNVPTFPLRSNPDNKNVTLKGIRLLLQQDQAITTTLTPLKIYRAALDFDISGEAVSYTLYSNPTFVAAHPCVGSHLAHRTETKAIRKTIIPAVDLKDTYLQYNNLLVIDATLKGEEVLARAWCSERGCNAVIWRGDETCFACAALMTMSTNGLGFNVLIRSM